MTFNNRNIFLSYRCEFAITVMSYTHNVTNQHIKNNTIITNQESIDWEISDFALIIADYINFIVDTNYCNKTIGFIKINISLFSL